MHILHQLRRIIVPKSIILLKKLINHVVMAHLHDQGPVGSRITLTMEDFQIEDDVTCYFDWLEVFLGGPHIGGAR